MLGFVKHLRQKWNDWCGDHEMEVAIRQHLTDNGYFGGTAQLKSVRLVAIQRPGWLQVYRFEVTARVNPGHGPSSSANDAHDDGTDDGTHEDVFDGGTPQYRDLFGLIREDVRKKLSTTRVFECEQERRSLFERWSEDLICLRGSQGLLE